MREKETYFKRNFFSEMQYIPVILSIWSKSSSDNCG